MLYNILDILDGAFSLDSYGSLVAQGITVDESRFCFVVLQYLISMVCNMSDIMDGVVLVLFSCDSNRS